MRFALRLSVIISTLAVVSTVLISFFAWRSTVRILQDRIEAEFEDSAQQVTNLVDQLLFERYHHIQVIAADSVLTSRDSSPVDITRRLIEYRNNYKVYMSLSFFDTNRIRIADTAGLQIGVRNDLTRYWRDVIRGQVSAGDDCEFSEDLNADVISFAAPVKDKSGKPLGVVVANVPMGILYSMINQIEKIRGIEKDHVLVNLVNRDGLLLYSSYDRKDVLKRRLSGWELIRQEIRNNQSGALTIGIPGQESCIRAYAQEPGFMDFPGNGWTLTMSVPQSVAFAPAMVLTEKLVLIFTDRPVSVHTCLGSPCQGCVRADSQTQRGSGTCGVGRVGLRDRPRQPPSREVGGWLRDRCKTAKG